MSTLDIAIQIASKAHEGGVDKSGLPYILHPLHLMNELKKKNMSMDHLIVAVLHDVVEDTYVTIQDLIDLDFKDDVRIAVSIMTHTKGVSYEDYIDLISTNEIAKAVKLEDLKHNLDVIRRVIPEYTITNEKKFMKRILKYTKAYDKLINGKLNV